MSFRTGLPSVPSGHPLQPGGVSRPTLALHAITAGIMEYHHQRPTFAIKYVPARRIRTVIFAAVCRAILPLNYASGQRWKFRNSLRCWITTSETLLHSIPSRRG